MISTATDKKGTSWCTIGQAAREVVRTEVRSSTETMLLRPGADYARTTVPHHAEAQRRLRSVVAQAQRRLSVPRLLGPLQVGKLPALSPNSPVVACQSKMKLDCPRLTSQSESSACEPYFSPFLSLLADLNSLSAFCCSQ